MRVRWTSEMDELLKQLRLAGRSYGEIARHMKISRCAAIGRAYRLSLKCGNVANIGHHRELGIITKTIFEFMNARIGDSIYISNEAGKETGKNAMVRAAQLGGSGWVTSRREGDGRRIWKIAEPRRNDAGKEAAQ